MNIVQATEIPGFYRHQYCFCIDVQIDNNEGIAPYIYRGYFWDGGTLRFAGNFIGVDNAR